MPLDVNSINSGKIAARSTQRKKLSKGSDAHDNSVNESNEDSVELTGKAAQIQQLIGQMMAAPAVDPSRVEPVKEKIDSGRYDIDAEQIANKMLEYESYHIRSR